MNLNEFYKIVEDFKQHGAKGIIKKYPKEELKIALREANINREEPWYEKMRQYIYNKEDKWYHSRLAVGIISAVIIALVGGVFTFYKQPAEVTDKTNQDMTNSLGGVQIAGDMAGEVNINIDSHERKDSKNKEKLRARIMIQRSIEDYQGNLDKSVKDYYKESDIMAGNFNSRGMLSSGVYIKAQMDFAVETKKKIDKLFIDLNRNIEDALLENFGTLSLLELSEFDEEKQQVTREEEKLRGLYKRIEDNVQSWEVRIFKETRLTKDFHL